MNLSEFMADIRGEDWQRPSVIALLLANLVPVFGVLSLGWQVFPLLFLFWSENVVIGAINVLKMLLAKPGSVADWLGKFFLIPFFCFHYGMFTMVHGLFLIALFGGGMRPGGFFPHPGVFWHIVQENHLGWAILGLAASRLTSFASNYLVNGEFERADLQQLMAQPYGRVMVMHVTLLAGAFLMNALHSPSAGLLLLIALKTILDLRGHLAERRKFAPQPAPAAVSPMI